MSYLKTDPQKVREWQNRSRTQMKRTRMTIATGKMRSAHRRAKRTVDGDSGRAIKAEMDQLVRDILALRDDRCFTCGILREQWPLEVGHMVHRVNERVRWNLQNCNAQCRECNGEHNNDAEIYIGCFVQRYGAEAYAELRRLSQRHNKPGYTELLNLRDSLRSELAQLKGSV